MTQRQGFTIFESMLASVVLAVVVLGLSGALAASHQQNELLRERGIQLQQARALAEEVAATPFTQADGTIGNGWSAGNKSHYEYDDVFDFNGYNDQSPFDAAVAMSKPVDVGGTYKRSVKVEPLATPTAAAASAAVAKFARVTVTVTAPSGRTFVLRRWVSRVEVSR